MKNIKKVNILKTTSGSQEIIGNVLLVDDKIHFANMSPMMEAVLTKGIMGKGEKKYTTKDGIKFLENLRYHFTGSYVRATRVL